MSEVATPTEEIAATTAPAKLPERSETASTVASECDFDDAELVAEAERLGRDDQLLPGARLIRQIKDESLITDELKEFLRLAVISEKLRADLMEPVSEGWTKQGESHGNRDFVTYYKIEDGGKLKCRIECVIESSLYVPFLSVMNETQVSC
jgi:hypothetical protein